MYKEKLEELSKNPKFIPGIFNYCDRWCERCPLTSRCMVFALSEEQFAEPEHRDINNENFWQKISEIFQVTLEKVKEMAEREGIDLDSPDIEAGAEEERRRDEMAREHECSRWAKVYGERVDSWFEGAKGLFEEKEEELNLKLRLEIPNVNPIEEAVNLEDAVDIIRWYQHQITVKVMRAIHGNLEENDEFMDEFPKDSEGSAKVALIGIDRSIAAWSKMRDHFPEQEDGILDLLLQLDRLRRRIEKKFPNARAFVRPGFDDLKS